MRYQEVSRTFICAASSLALAISLGLAGGTTAFGEEDAQSQATSSVADFEEASKAYLAAEEELQSIEQKIAENETKQADLEKRLPEQRSRTAASVKTMYLFQQSSSGLLDLLLSADDFNDFITTVRYIDAIQQRNTAEINALVDMETELVNTQAELSTQRDEAIKKRDEADAKMADASAALRQARAAQRVLQASGEILTQQVPATQESPSSSADASSESQETTSASQQQEQSTTSEQEQTQEPAQAEQASPAQTDTESTPAATTPSSSSSSSPSSSEDWAARIDAYLEGTELAGHGADFAAAAEEYGVDPRISPAISRIERGSGEVCFRPHNAWGWGTASWDDWTSAIYGHVSGFSEGYGSTLTLDGAQWYAGTDMYGEWYNLVQQQMSLI